MFTCLSFGIDSGLLKVKIMTCSGNSAKSFSVDEIRRDFPILASTVNDKPLVYFDNAATAQKPSAVINRIGNFYSTENANIHRGVHALSQQATEEYEEARKLVARFIGAENPSQVVFTRGATESINLVAGSYGRKFLDRGSRILLTEQEHHANIVPWQILAEEKELEILVAPVDDSGRLIVDAALELIAEQEPDFVGIIHASNAASPVNPVEQIVEAAHQVGAKVLVDGAQALPHFPVDVSRLGADFYTFSGHKLFGPTGIGVLYGKAAILGEMPPWQGGGDMIRQVSFNGTTFRDPPERFEAGTPNIAGAIGLGAAVKYLQSIDWAGAIRHEAALVDHALGALGEFPGIRILGGKGPRVSLVSFLMEGVHPHDIGSFLDAAGIAVRTGHHCAQPLMRRLGITGTTRASFAFYNTIEEVDLLVRELHRIRKFFS